MFEPPAHQNNGLDSNPVSVNPPVQNNNSKKQTIVIGEDIYIQEDSINKPPVFGFPKKQKKDFFGNTKPQQIDDSSSNYQLPNPLL